MTSPGWAFLTLGGWTVSLPVQDIWARTTGYAPNGPSPGSPFYRDCLWRRPQTIVSCGSSPKGQKDNEDVQIRDPAAPTVGGHGAVAPTKEDSVYDHSSLTDSWRGTQCRAVHRLAGAAGSRGRGSRTHGHAPDVERCGACRAP